MQTRIENAADAAVLSKAAAEVLKDGVLRQNALGAVTHAVKAR